MKVAIIGGGIAGMSTAFYLSKIGHKVTVYEKEKDLGGLARSFALKDNFLEKYYHHIFLTDTYAIKLIEETGLSGALLWEESRMGLYCDDNVYAFGTPLDLFRFKPLSLIDKLRFALSTMYLAKVKDYSKLEAISAEEFLIKSAGSNVYKKIWEPLLATKFGEKHYKKITAGWLYARVSSRGRSKKGLFEREKLGYLDGSLNVLFDKLKDMITERGGNVFTASEVERIDIDSNKKIIVKTDKGYLDEAFDKCCLCIPNKPILKIAGHVFSGSYNKSLESIEYRAVLCLVLLIGESLSPYYWLNISQRGVPFTGLMEHTNLVSKGKYSENDVIYLSRYISANDSQYNMPNEDLVDYYSKHIKDIFPRFDKSTIKESFVFRDTYAQPIVTKGHKDRMPSIRSAVDNIFINNPTQIYPDDRGMSPGIRQSIEVANIVNEESN